MNFLSSIQITCQTQNTAFQLFLYISNAFPSLRIRVQSSHSYKTVGKMIWHSQVTDKCDNMPCIHQQMKHWKVFPYQNSHKQSSEAHYVAVLLCPAGSWPATSTRAQPPPLWSRWPACPTAEHSELPVGTLPAQPAHTAHIIGTVKFQWVTDKIYQILIIMCRALRLSAHTLMSIWFSCCPVWQQEHLL